MIRIQRNGVQGEMMTIAQDSVVSFDYTLKDDKGTVLDTSDGREPLEYLHGHGQLVRGVENGLKGKIAGDSVSLVVPPEDGYGVYDEKLLIRVHKNKIEGDEKIEVGSPVVVHIQGRDHVFTIARMTETDVVLDGNHPLAGATLHFDITVRNVREALPDELSHGHSHSQGNDGCGECCDGKDGDCGSGCGGCG
jgi:FKBP-type peptidyl-prolyl cis-trans isomerase SlyD